METIGERITRLREQRRWSQQELADLLGVSLRTVGNWENNHRSPRNRLGALEQIFGQSLTEDVPAGDPVEVAIERSRLTEDRQLIVKAAYKRELREQDYEDERRRLA